MALNAAKASSKLALVAESTRGIAFSKVRGATFGAGEGKRAKKLFSLLKKNKFEYGNEVSVHTGTLTAELRRRVKAGDIPSPADLAKIGGYVREVVNTEPVKKD